MMKKRTFREKISYRFDCLMSKGTIATSLLLFVVTAGIVLFIGILSYFAASDGTVMYQIWNSLMCTIDTGNLAAVSPDNLWLLLLMSLATLCGLFVTSVLIGLITSGVERKLGELRKGTSVVQEDDHTVVIGFDSNIYTIIQELIEANANHRHGCIVILGKEEKEKMEDAIASHVSDTKTTRIICRSGSFYHPYALERCSIETAKSVIINGRNDEETVKILLSLSNYVKNKSLRNSDLHFVASLEDKEYLEIAHIAGDGRGRIIFMKDAIARIISNTCRQHGVSQVLTELFNFEGDELYFEKIPALTGKTFREAALSMSNAIPIGIFTAGETKINPPADQIIREGDQLILLAEDDGSYRLHGVKSPDTAVICDRERESAMASDHLIVFGSNDKLPIILDEYDKYVDPGTKVIIVDDNMGDIALGEYKNIHTSICTEPITRDLLCRFLDTNANNILLLNDDSIEAEASDSQTLLRLLLIRDIADKKGLYIAITTELQSVDNQRLASRARVDDFVIGSNFSSLIKAQISENPYLIPVFDELLDDRGSELYTKPAENYVSLGVPVDSYTLAESAARKDEVYIGYRKIGSGRQGVVVNPNKEEKVTFGPLDQIIVIAED